MKLKKIIHTCIIIGATCATGYYLLTGKYGIEAEHIYKNTISEKLKTIETVQKEIVLLEKELTEWQTLPFLKEKGAREELHMSCTNEWIYYIK